jgi:hypothetical protein
MQTYYFQAVDESGKKVSGSVAAVNEVSARESLKAKGLAVLSIEAFDAGKQKIAEGLKRFVFVGIDTNGKVARGAIEAEDGYQAYKKLKSEFSLKLQSLGEENSKNKMIDPAWEVRYKEDMKGAKKDPTEKQATEGQSIKLSEKDKAELAFYQEKIGEIVQEVTTKLEASKSFLNSEKRRDIMERVNLLSRLRRSNAVDHLKKLTDKILTELADDALFLDQEKLTEEQKQQFDIQKASITQTSQQFSKKLTDGLQNISFDLSGIDAKAVAQSVVKIDIFSQLGLTFYWTAISLFSLLVVFWIVNALRVFGDNEEAILFLFRSSTLWFLTGFAGIISFTFVPIAFSREKTSWGKRGLFVAIAFIALVIFIFEFHAIFSWTR